MEAAHFSKTLITALGLMGLFLLLIACINFINLATAQAVNRSKEVGIRKVLGSSKKQLIVQFLCETFLITLFSVLVAIVFAALALPVLNSVLRIALGHAARVNPGCFFMRSCNGGHIAIGLLSCTCVVWI